MILLKKQKKYAWINVKVCMLVLFVNGMVMQTYGIFIPHMRDDFGTDTASVSLAVTVLNAVMVLFGPIAVKLVEKWKMKRVLTVALFAFAIFVTGISYNEKLKMLYLLYALCGCCMYFGIFYLCPYIVNHWFGDNAPQVIAIIIMFLAIGGSIGNLVLAKITEISTWRNAYRFVAVLLVITAVVTAIFLKDDQEEVGLERPKQGLKKENKESQERKNTITIENVYRQTEFYCVILYVACMQLCVSVQSQIPNLALSFGFTTAVGAIAASLNSCGGIPAKFLLSICNVKIGVLKSVLLYNLVGICGIISLLVFQNPFCLYIFALLFGFTIGSTTVQLPVLSTRLFGCSADYDKIHSRIVLISGILAMPGSFIAGWSYDRTGSYQVALLALIVNLTIAAVAVRIALRKKGGRNS